MTIGETRVDVSEFLRAQRNALAARCLDLEAELAIAQQRIADLENVVRPTEEMIEPE